jgi:bifunctional N-acetylglucosamine-1-phosphate-uridyltransferase/glucosamine-1-phosphate-acetyltransferase GlmU-like protein
MAMQINALIIASEVTKGMKSMGSKSLLKLKNSILVIEHQIIELRKHYKNIDITISTGFEAEKMTKALSSYRVRFLYNEDYKNTNQGKSVVDYVNYHSLDNLLLINSGILFKSNFGIITNESCVFMLDKPKPDFTIGCNNNSDAFYLFYDLPDRWSECIFLHHQDLLTIKNISKDKNLSQLYLFEIINTLSEMGSIFKKIRLSKSSIMKISNVKDLTRARSFV